VLQKKTYGVGRSNIKRAGGCRVPLFDGAATGSVGGPPKKKKGDTLESSWRLRAPEGGGARGGASSK